jgi:hypothetical protein
MLIIIVQLLVPDVNLIVPAYSFPAANKSPQIEHVNCYKFYALKKGPMAFFMQLLTRTVLYLFQPAQHAGSKPFPENR